MKEQSEEKPKQIIREQQLPNPHYELSREANEQPVPPRGTADYALWLAKQVNKDRLEALDAQYDWHLKAEEESNKPERQHGNMENLPWVLLAIVLALIASLAVEIVRKATPECPAGTVTHHPGERAAMRRQGTGTLAHNPCAMRPRIAASRQRSSISRCISSYSRRLLWYSRSTSSSRERCSSSPLIGSPARACPAPGQRSDPEWTPPLLGGHPRPGSR